MGNSASVTPKGTELAAPRPDIDVEICPPGTMAAMEAIITAIDPANVVRWPESRGYLLTDGLRASIAQCRAILTAHRSQLDPGPTIEQAAGRTQSFFAVCENAQAARQSYVFDANAEAQEPPKLEIDYTSETEDLSTWPQTRGPEWRRMAKAETMRQGDVCRIGPRFQIVDGVSNWAVEWLSSGECWTRRPAPEAQP